jgi:hypothetical protein
MWASLAISTSNVEVSKIQFHAECEDTVTEISYNDISIITC